MHKKYLTKFTAFHGKNTISELGMAQNSFILTKIFMRNLQTKSLWTVCFLSKLNNIAKISSFNSLFNIILDILAGERVKQTTVQDPVLPINNCCCCCLIAKTYPMLSDLMDYSPPGSSVHGISQARILEWVDISFSRGSYWIRNRTCVSCTGRRILYHWATREALWLCTATQFCCCGRKAATDNV